MLFRSLVVILLEIGMSVLNYGVDFVGTTVKNYPRGTTYAASMVRYMKERSEDELFYRAEVTHSQTLNDGALNDYNGISAFTSSANVHVTSYMKALGYGAMETYNRYCFEESSPVSNLFLNLRYMLERDGRVEENNYFDAVHHFGNVYLLENNAYLPLGFLADNQILNVTVPTTETTFAFQNKLFTAATGIPENVWSWVSGKNLTITGHGIEVNDKPASNYCYYKAGASDGTIVFKFTANRSGLFCIDLNLPKRNAISVWKNDQELYTESYSIPQSLAVSEVVRGDTVEVRLSCKANTKSSAVVRAAILNEETFREGYDLLAASTLQLTSFSNTRVEGTINCNRAGVLYTSIPQDGNWSATVDGKPAQIALIGDAMIGLLLPEGEHNIVFTYKNEAFSLGWKISLVCGIILFFLCKIFYPSHRKNGKYELERGLVHDRTVTEDSGEPSDP